MPDTCIEALPIGLRSVSDSYRSASVCSLHRQLKQTRKAIVISRLSYKESLSPAKNCKLLKPGLVNQVENLGRAKEAKSQPAIAPSTEAGPN